MKTFLGFLCFVLLSQGVGGLLYELTDGWFQPWSVVSRMGFFDGYEIYVSVVLLVAGGALGAASAAVTRKGGG
ncbi:hypothetical protein ACIQVO_01500 [Streptomyces sp. NPDC101062]|uniref:hypothetical protein n=1 Tax=unclassified Streptomyces TaxID=2593676 RepID=UPI002E7A5D1A|nr:hypothetical protein [Streptomyces sp. JV176]MEE1798496.1 hypothetical protein [Streptomyces sp. JV176]